MSLPAEHKIQRPATAAVRSWRTQMFENNAFDPNLLKSVSENCQPDWIKEPVRQAMFVGRRRQSDDKR
jgi:hypothetical protein